MGMVVSLSVWPWITNFGGLIAFCFVYGLFGGGFISLVAPLLADYFGIETLSSMLGVIYPAAGFGSVLGPPITGILFDQTGSYTIGIYIAAALTLISLIFLLFLPKLQTNLPVVEGKVVPLKEENS